MTNLSLVIDDDADDDSDDDNKKAKKTQKCIRLNHRIKMRFHYNVSESGAYMRSLYNYSISIYKCIKKTSAVYE